MPRKRGIRPRCVRERPSSAAHLARTVTRALRHPTAAAASSSTTAASPRRTACVSPPPGITTPPTQPTRHRLLLQLGEPLLAPRPAVSYFAPGRATLDPEMNRPMDIVDARRCRHTRIPCV